MVKRVGVALLLVLFVSEARAERRDRPDPAKTYSVPIGNSPVTGKKSALVTLVLAGEFADPFGERLRPTLEQLLADYPNELRIVHKHFVVHPQSATDAAHAACAAHQQGKFWEMRELIWDKGFKDSRQLDAAHMVTLAQEAGLDIKKFEAAMNGKKCAKIVRAEYAQMARVGTTGVPSSYINGRHLSGAQPYERFQALIDEELAKAKKRTKKSKKRRRNYYRTWVLKKGLKQTPKLKAGQRRTPRAANKRKRPDPKATYSVPLGDSPYRGPKHAKITMVMACQFTGPFCKKIRSTIDELFDKYGKNIKLVFKHYVVHVDRATIPHLAACAAHKQGKYMAMESLLWGPIMDDKDWTRTRMRAAAEQIGLDMTQFGSDMSGVCKQKIKSEQAQMARVGTTGTPAVYINGRFISGARPADQFAIIIDEELAKANKRIRNKRDLRRYYQKWVIDRGVKKFSRY